MLLQRRAISWVVVAAAALLASCGPATEEEFQAGLDAYARGDFQAAIDKWRPLADEGHAAAQSNLGVIYYQGQGVPADPAEGVKWYKLAAAQKYPDALYNLGVAHAEGKGVEKNGREALRWYREAAQAGYEPAQFILGEIYSQGIGVEADDAEATKWYTAAANQGNARAQFQVGTAYANARGVKRDLVKAFMWYHVASLQEDVGARFDADRGKRRITEEMTEFEMAEAERLAMSWMEQFRTRSRPQ
jgi:TPR repeat protein